MTTDRFAFLPDLASRTRRAALWLGLPIVVLALVPFLVLALSEVDWARIPDKATIIGIAVAIVGIATGVYEYMNHHSAHRGRNKRRG